LGDKTFEDPSISRFSYFKTFEEIPKSKDIRDDTSKVKIGGTQKNLRPLGSEVFEF
tara:strand:- start:2797 stop:2964 length:168 start_codon:yes stop_codon:yes gene_type:complete